MYFSASFTLFFKQNLPQMDKSYSSSVHLFSSIPISSYILFLPSYQYKLHPSIRFIPILQAIQTYSSTVLRILS